MRIRTLKPGFFSSEDLSSISPESHLLAAGVLCISDDSGFFNANPALIKADVFPLRETSVSIQDMLSELVRVGYVRIGTGEDRRRYGQVVKFTEHQRINRPTPSKIKDLRIEWDASMSTHGAISEDSPLERKGKEGSQEGGKEKTLTSKPENGFDQPVLGDDFRSPEPQQRLESGWGYYMTTIGRNPKLYTWTPERKQMGMARLRDLRKRSGSWENAEALMRLCTDRMRMSEFHNGQNAQGKKYLDWEHLFSSTKRMERWLNDDNFAPGVANGKASNSEGERLRRCS
jgi:hypothetical protein